MSKEYAITMRDPHDLTPYEGNPRTHTPAQVENIIASITEFGFRTPVVVDENDTVLVGHARIMAAKEMHLKEVPTLTVTGMSDQQKAAYVIADNKAYERGGWDMELMVAELNKIDGSGIDWNALAIDPVQYGLDREAPTFTDNTTNARDIERSEAGLQSQIDGLSADQANSGQSVICPKCRHEFRFTGN